MDRDSFAENPEVHCEVGESETTSDSVRAATTNASDVVVVPDDASGDSSPHESDLDSAVASDVEL